MKRVISVFVALTMIVSAFAFASTNASAVDYNPQSALDYAEENWDNGIELCAGFVSNCLQAGGINVMERSVGNLFNALKGTYGTAHVLKTDGPYIYFDDNAGKLSPGDPVFYYCNSCKSFQHAILCGDGEDGLMTDYAHNNPHHNTTTYISWGCPECGDINWTMYAISLSSTSNHVLLTPKRLRKRQHAARRELIHTSVPAVTATMLLRRKPSIRQFGSTQKDRRFTTPALSIWSVLFVTRQYQHLLLLLSQRQM